MNRSFLLTCTMVLTLVLPVQARGEGGYAGIRIIDAIQSAWCDNAYGNVRHSAEHTQHTLGGGIFVGYDFYPAYKVPLRLDIEYTARTALEKTLSGSVGMVPWEVGYSANLHTLMGNVYLDLHNSTPFTPYVGAGLGVGLVLVNYEVQVGGPMRLFAHEADLTLVQIAWSVGAGCTYAINETASVDLSYRFLNVPEAEFEGAKARMSAHEVGVALRLHF